MACKDVCLHGRLVAIVFAALLTQGCAAVALGVMALPIAGLAKLGFASKPQMEYTIENSKEFALHISTYSANIASVKNMTDIGASMVAKEQMHCPRIAITYAKWPNSLVKAAIKVNTVVTYACTSKAASAANNVAGLVGAVIDVEKKLRYEAELVQTVRQHNLLRPKGSAAGAPKSRMPALFSSRKAEGSAPAPTQAQPSSGLVTQTQEKLKKLGYNVGTVDGKFGAKTEAAIQDFQLDNDLEITGKPSTSLLRVINAKLQ